MSRNCQIIVQEEREEWERLSTVVTLNTSRTRAPLCSRFFNQRSRIVSRRKGFSEGSTSLKVTILTIVPLVVIRTPIRAIYYNRAWASTCYVYVVWSQQSLCFLRSFPPSSRRVFFHPWARELSFFLVGSRHGPLYIFVAICNDRRRHLHSTLHVPSVYSRKTCNRGDQSIYIQIPFLAETHAT